MPDNETQKYSDEVLEDIAPRAAKLLNAIGAEPVIRTLMESGGMTAEDIAEGGQLLLACWSQLPGTEAETDTDDAKTQREAVAVLDAWDQPYFARYGATLARRFPQAGAYVFFELKASDGSAAVAGVATFLSRIEALEKGTDPERAGSKKDDKKAVELLASRGLDKKERERLDGLVKIALKPTSALPAASAKSADRAAARIAALTALKDWFDEWAATARVVVQKRAHLIRMGLAYRKSPKTGPEGEGE